MTILNLLDLDANQSSVCFLFSLSDNLLHSFHFGFDGVGSVGSEGMLENELN